MFNSGKTVSESQDSSFLNHNQIEAGRLFVMDSIIASWADQNATDTVAEVKANILPVNISSEEKTTQFCSLD